MMKLVRLSRNCIYAFIKDNGFLRASSLTLNTLLSIVPVLAIAFGIAKGFGIEHLFEKELLGQFPEQSVALSQSMGFARNLLETTNGSLIAGIGIVILLATVMSLFYNIEDAFNHIWKITQERTMFRKFSNYLAGLLIFPIFFVMISSLTIYVSSKVIYYTPHISFIHHAASILLKLLSFSLSCLLFVMIYRFLPAVRISLKTTTISGIIAGIAYQVVQTLYVKFQIGAGSYGAVYGSFAALPLFISWIQLSWIIVLFGAELAYQLENYGIKNDERFEDQTQNLETSFLITNKTLVAFPIVHLCIESFLLKIPPLSIPNLAFKLNISESLVREIVKDLEKKGLLVEIHRKDDLPTYQPAFDPQSITSDTIFKAMEANDDSYISGMDKDTTGSKA